MRIKTVKKAKRQTKKDPSGLVYVFSGDGKGKTSAALGVAVRAAAVGMKVAWVSWYKDPQWDIAEFRLPKKFKNLKMHAMGKGFYLSGHRAQRIVNREKKIKVAQVGKKGEVVVDVASEKEHKEAAKAAMVKAGVLMDKVEVLVLDEVNNAVKDGLVTLIDLIDLISRRKRTHLVLTGRGAHSKIVKLADLVTNLKKVKHPFTKGKLAVRGLDF